MIDIILASDSGSNLNLLSKLFKKKISSDLSQKIIRNPRTISELNKNILENRYKILKTME